MTRYFVLYHLRTAAFVAVGMAAIFAVFYVQRSQELKLRHSQQLVASRLRQAQIDACARGNVLRANVNAETRIIRYFMLAAAAARQRAGRPADLAAAARYRAFAKSLNVVAIPDCENVVGQIDPPRGGS